MKSISGNTALTWLFSCFNDDHYTRLLPLRSLVAISEDNMAAKRVRSQGIVLNVTDSRQVYFVAHGGTVQGELVFA